jgi:hypothetical protein
MVLGVLIAVAPKVTTAVRLSYFDREAEIERIFTQHVVFTVKEMETGRECVGLMRAVEDGIFVWEDVYVHGRETLLDFLRGEMRRGSALNASHGRSPTWPACRERSDS